jgi:hypothetical protein
MTTAITSVNSSTTSQLLLAADATRTSVTLENTDANTLYVALGQAATTSIGGYTFSRNYGASATLTPPESYQAIYGIWSADGSGGVTITAVTDPVQDDNGAISTYGELKTAIAAWLKPGTTLPAEETASRIPEYVALFEAEANRVLRVKDMDAQETSLTVTSGAATRPAGLRRLDTLKNTAYPYSDITYIPADVFDRLYPSTSGTAVRYCTLKGSTLYFWPAITTSVSLTHKRVLTALTNDNDYNWLLRKHPDAYLYGALINADRRLIDPERIGLVEPRYREVMRQIQQEEAFVIGMGLRPQPSASFVA